VLAIAITLLALQLTTGHGGGSLADPVAALAADGVIMASFLLADATADSLIMRLARTDA
jgi:hypothetical protein